MPRILVVDDDPHIRKLLRQMLVLEGFAIAEAKDGKEALEIQSREPADVVITDIIMPEKGGIDTIRELQRLNPDVKIIAMSGGGFLGPEEHLSLPRRMGVQFAFPKPVRKDDIVSAVRALLA